MVVGLDREKLVKAVDSELKVYLHSLYLCKKLLKNSTTCSFEYYNYSLLPVSCFSGAVGEWSNDLVDRLSFNHIPVTYPYRKKRLKIN